MPHDRRIAVIGLGYVGLPVAVAFARAGNRVIAFDIDPDRLAELQAGRDRTREVEEADLRNGALRFTGTPSDLREADFIGVLNTRGRVSRDLSCVLQ